MTRFRAWLTATVLLAGCDSPRGEAAAASANAPTPPWSYDDRALEVKAAVVAGFEGDRSLRLTLAAEPLGCDEASRQLVALPPRTDAPRVDIWLAPTLAPDGSYGELELRGATFVDASGARGLTAHGAMVERATLDNTTLSIENLELALSDAHRVKDEVAPQMHHEGPVRAQRCKRVPRPEAARPQTSLTVSVASQPVDIQGASLRRRDEQLVLRLTPTPHDCDSRFGTHDLYLDITFRQEPLRVELAALQGLLFPDSPATSAGTEGVKLTLSGPLHGAQPVEVTVKGRLTLGRHLLVLDGSVAPLLCTAPP